MTSPASPIFDEPYLRSTPGACLPTRHNLSPHGREEGTTAMHPLLNPAYGEYHLRSALGAGLPTIYSRGLYVH